MRVATNSLFVLLSLAPAIATAQVVPTDKVKRNVVVRAEPRANSAPIEKLDPDSQAELIRDLPRWYEIRTPGGATGFVSKQWTDLLSTTTRLPTAAVSNGPYFVHVIDVGTGLSVFIDGPDFTMLYDAGSQDDLAAGDDNRVVSYIRAVHPGLKTIDHLVLSHPHKDHLELMPDVFDKYEIRNVWDSGAMNPTIGYCRFLKAVASEKADSRATLYHDAIATGGTHEVTFKPGKCSGKVSISQANQMTGDKVPIGRGAFMTILYRDAHKHTDPNENTVVLRLDLGTKRILLAGDAEAGERRSPVEPPDAGSIEDYLLKKTPGEVKADALVVGHHGSKTSSRKAFLDAVDASIFVISSGPHPYKKIVLPDPAIRDEINSRPGVKLLETDLDDPACAEPDRDKKIGPDNDESPGGCDNVLISINAAGELVADYYRKWD